MQVKSADEVIFCGQENSFDSRQNLKPSAQQLTHSIFQPVKGQRYKANRGAARAEDTDINSTAEREGASQA